VKHVKDLVLSQTGESERERESEREIEIEREVEREMRCDVMDSKLGVIVCTSHARVSE
jgi:hypothetical protein